MNKIKIIYYKVAIKYCEIMMNFYHKIHIFCVKAIDFIGRFYK